MTRMGWGHSRVFPGLRLLVAALLAGDTAKVLEASTGRETSVNGEDTGSGPANGPVGCFHQGTSIRTGSRTQTECTFARRAARVNE